MSIYLWLCLIVSLAFPSFQQQVRIDICAFDASALTAFLKCAIDSAPDATKQKWEKTKELFKGRTPEEAILKLCSNAPTTGVAIINGFINQQSKGDKPKLKKLLVECNQEYG